MNISDETKLNHEQLSGASVKFLEFAAKNPDAQLFKSFPAIASFDDGEQSKLNGWPAFVGAAMNQQMKEASEGIVSLLKQVPRRVFNNDPRKIAGYFEIPGKDAETALAGWEAEDIDNLLGRGDFVLSPSGFKCIEFNLAANLGGILDSQSRPLYMKNPVISKFSREYDVKFKETAHTTVLLLKHLLDDALERCKGAKEEKEVNIAILIGERPAWKPVRPHETHLLHALRQLLQTDYRHIKSNLLFSNGNFFVRDNNAYLGGKRIHSVVTAFFHPGPQLTPVFKAGNILLYNGSITAVLCQKLLLAALSEYRDSGLFTPEECRIIDEHLPWTRKIHDTRTMFHNEEINLIQFVRSNKDLLVLKPSTGLGGEDVCIGCFTPQSQWEKLVDHAVIKRNWLVQEFIEPVDHMFQAGENGCDRFQSIWGLFTFGNRYADGFLRIMPVKKFSGVINCKLGATVGMFLNVEE